MNMKSGSGIWMLFAVVIVIILINQHMDALRAIDQASRDQLGKMLNNFSTSLAGVAGVVGLPFTGDNLYDPAKYKI